MILIDYEVACRSCMIADNISRSILFNGKLDRFYDGDTMKSEYEIEGILSNILNTEEDACSYCGSYNLEFSNIRVEGKNPHINSKATLFQLIISTTPNGDVSIKNRGHQYIPPGFHSEALNLIEDVINTVPSEKFEEKETGHLHLTVSSIYVGDTFHRKNRFEKLSFSGFSEQQVSNFISIAKKHYSK